MALPELDKLIVEHLGDIDATAKRLWEIETQVFAAISAAANAWAKKEGWVGEFNYPNKTLWLAPPEWRKMDTAVPDNLFDASFEMGYGSGDTGTPGTSGQDHFLLTRLCRVGTGEFGFIFKPDLITRAPWKRHFKGLRNLVEKTAFVADSDSWFFLPFRFDAVKLAESLGEESVEDALAPFEKTLAQIGEARSAFDTVIAAVRPPGAQVVTSIAAIQAA